MEKINIVNLSEGRHEFSFKPVSDEFLLGEIECKDLQVRVVVDKTGSQLVFSINVTGKFVLPCDRCTDKYEHPFDNVFEIVYKYDYSGEMNSEDTDDIKFISPRTVFIDLTDEVRDFLLLSVPLKAVPADLNGICSICGMDIEKYSKQEESNEINPVWEKLLKIKTKEE